MTTCRTVVLDRRKQVRLVLNTVIKGCGRRKGVLTFYYLREELRDKEAESWRLACGRGATTTYGWPGILLCQRCEVKYGLAH